VRDDAYLVVEIGEARACGFEFGAADVGRAVENLAVEVRRVDVVEVDEADRADAGGGEVGRGG